MLPSGFVNLVEVVLELMYVCCLRIVTGNKLYFYVLFLNNSIRTMAFGYRQEGIVRTYHGADGSER